MSNVVNKAMSISRRIGNTLTGSAFKKPKIPKMPETPTIDTAAQAQIESDRLTRRRGVLANIFTNSNTEAPNVARKTLLGG